MWSDSVRRCPRGPIHLLVDSRGLRLCGPGEWLVDKHGTRKRRSWRTLHLGVDAETGQILASELTSHDVDDSSQVDPHSVRSPIHSPPPVMEPTIKRVSTSPSASSILMLKSSFHPDQRQSRVRM